MVVIVTWFIKVSAPLYVCYLMGMLQSADKLWSLNVGAAQMRMLFHLDATVTGD